MANSNHKYNTISKQLIMIFNLGTLANQISKEMQLLMELLNKLDFGIYN